MDLNHLHLYVRDIAASRRFYEKYLGFQRERLNEGDLIIVQNGEGFDLAFAFNSNPPRMPSGFHFGFRLAEPQAVRDLHLRMTSEGVPLARPLKEYDDYVTFTCTDPDGYEIEVYCEPVGDSYEKQQW